MGTSTHPAPGGSRGRWPARAGWALDAAVVAALVALAVVLRWPAMGPSSLWLDDAWVALVWRTDGLTELRFVGFAAPGFVALLRVWFAVVGFSELAAQLPAFVAGVLTPAGAYLLTRWRGWYRAAGVLAGVSLVVSPIAVVYATRVKQYTTEALLALAVIALALWLADRPGATRRWAVLVTVGAAGTVVSAFLAPIVAAGLLAGLVAGLRARDRAAVRAALAWGTGYGLAALGWYLAVLAPAVTTSISGFWSGDFLVVDAGAGALVASLRGTLVGLVTGWLPLSARIGAGVLAAALAVLAVAALRWRAPEPDPDPAATSGPPPGARGGDDPLVLLIALATPLVVAVVLAGLQLAPLGGGRTDLYLYSSLSLLVAAGTHTVLAALAPRRTPALAAALAASAAAVPLLLAAEPVGGYPRWDVRPLVAEVEQLAADDEVILVYPATMWAYALYSTGEIRLEPDDGSAWGFAPRFDDPRVVVLPRGRDDPDAYAPTVVALASGDAPVVWLVASHWREDLDDLRVMLTTLGFDGEQVAHRDGAVLERYLRR